MARKGFAQTKKVRRTEPSRDAEEGNGNSYFLIPILLFAAIWITAIFSISYRQQTPPSHYVPGQIADRFIYSEVSFEYEDPALTKIAREEAARDVPPTYQIDTGRLGDSIRMLEQLRTAVLFDNEQTDARSDGSSADDSENLPSSVTRLCRTLSDRQVADLQYVIASQEKWNLLRELVSNALNDGIVPAHDKTHGLARENSDVDEIHLVNPMGNRIRRLVCPVENLRDPESAATYISDALFQHFPDNAEAGGKALMAVLPKVLSPNIVYDSEATEERRREAAEAVKTITRVVPANTILLRRGRKVTESDIVQLRIHQQEARRQRGLRRAPTDMLLIPGLCLLLVLGFASCLWATNPEALLHENRDLALIAIVIMLQMILTRATASAYYTMRSTSFFLFSILPLSFGSMLLSPLLGLRIALWTGVFSAIMVAIQTGQMHSLHLFTVGFLSSIVAALLMRRVRKRFHAIRTGIGVSFTIFVLNLIFAIQQGIPLAQIPLCAAYAFANGVITSVVVSTLLPIFEYVFGITTEISLVELNDLNHPLLKRLQFEAPGTYHHSLMVATLAEQAAEAIGANPLLTRICAYFHDIGKLAHPEYFTENVRERNPHDELQPRMSSLVILNHVKEGIDLALKNKLNKPIREAIAQHHGTSLVYFFYRRAIEKTDSHGKDADVSEGEYRYPGPKPMRKEIALVSIADACEAACRSLEKPTHAKIESLVNELVLQRIQDHQLDNADLTLRELQIAKETIIKSLASVFHARVSYPKEYKNENGDRTSAAPPPPEKTGAAGGADGESG